MVVLNKSGEAIQQVSRTENEPSFVLNAGDQIEPLRDIDDFCRLLGVPKKSVYKWTSDRFSGIPFYKVGRHLKFRFSEVDAWLRKYRASESVREFTPRTQVPENRKSR